MLYYGMKTREEHRIADLESELAEVRYQEERRREQEQREREESHQEQRREREEAMSRADGWEEAFWKGLSRIRREAAEEEKANRRWGGVDSPDYDPSWKTESWFVDWLKQVERAQILYQGQQTELEAELEEVRRRHLGIVADRLAAEFGESETVEALREDNPGYLVEW